MSCDEDAREAGDATVQFVVANDQAPEFVMSAESIPWWEREVALRESGCEVTDFVDHDEAPAAWSWECTCGANERGFVSRRDRDAAADRHLAISDES